MLPQDSTKYSSHTTTYGKRKKKKKQNKIVSAGSPCFTISLTALFSFFIYSRNEWLSKSETLFPEPEFSTTNFQHCLYNVAIFVVFLLFFDKTELSTWTDTKKLSRDWTFSFLPISRNKSPLIKNDLSYFSCNRSRVSNKSWLFLPWYGIMETRSSWFGCFTWVSLARQWILVRIDKMEIQ